MGRHSRFKSSIMSSLGTAIFLAIAPVAHGETLGDALSIAYRTNPTVQAQRANVRATGELRHQAVANLLPQLTANGNITRQEIRQEGAFTTTDFEQLDGFSYGGNGDQLIFDGLRSIYAVKQAADQIDAAEAQLVAVEQQLLIDVATAYFDVLRDMEVFSFNNSNVEVLVRQLEQASVRFRVGEITRTDVAQADARLASSRAEMTNARAQLAVSRARYVELVGQSPGTLEKDITLPELPADLETSLELAKSIAPAILIAKATERSSNKNIKIAKGTFSPTITANINYQFADEPNNFVSETESFTYGVRADVPLFQGGARLSQIRRAKANNDGDRQRVIEAERQVASQVTAAWEQLKAAESTIISAQKAVEANELALRGVRKEALVGTRDTLDVLNAELESLNAQVGLVSAQRNAQVATFSLMGSIGMLTPQSVGILPYEEKKSGGFGIGRFRIGNR